MEHTDAPRGEDSSEDTPEVPSPQSPRKLPDDLPTSLDDRRSFPSYGGETEMYDAWQGQHLPLPALLLPSRALNADDESELEQARLNTSLHQCPRSLLPSI